MRPPNRLQPAMPAGAYKTYALLAPKTTHRRPASCAEVDCPAHRNGWATTVVPGSDDEALLLRAAGGGVDGRRRHYTRHPQGDGFVRYVFPDGQACFRAASHTVPLEREPIYVVRDGDWRGNPRGTDPRRHTRGADWVDDFATHQDTLADRLRRG